MVPSPPPGECVCTPASPTDSGEDSHEGDFHSKCILIRAFYNMSLSLTIEQQLIWEAWIQEVENTIFVNMSLSSDEKVVLCSLSLKAFFAVHIDIYNELSYMEIADWGFVIDFLYVSINIQLEITQSVVTVDGNGRCDLTDAIKNASKNGSPNEQSACNNLVLEIEAILSDMSLSYEMQLSMCFELFQSFFVQHPDMESFVLSINIEGYGSIESFLAVCKTYSRITTISTVISGSSEVDCVLCAALKEAATNGSFTTAQQTQILQLKAKLELYFKSTTSIKLRLKYISTTCHEMFKLEPWMLELVESIMCGDWGSIYDIIFCSGICTNHGCGDLDNEATTTASPTTPSSSAGSTAMVPANCATIGDLIVVDSKNETVITNVLLQAYASWTFNQRTGFNSCFNKVRRAIWNNVMFPTKTLKLKELNLNFKEYNANNPPAQDLVFNLTISVWQGTIRQFVECAGSCCANAVA